MKSPLTIAAIGLSTLLLAACDDGGTTTSSDTTPTAAQQACLAAVSNETNNGDVSVISSEFSEAGTFVTVGVGETRAPWRCIAYADGTTDGIEFMGDG